MSLRMGLGSSPEFSIYSGSIARGATPKITYPTSLSTLSSPSESFTWSTGGLAPLQWWLYLGSAPLLKEYFNESAGKFTSVQAGGYPTSGGGNVYATLWYQTLAGVWVVAHQTVFLSPLVSETLNYETGTNLTTDSGLAFTRFSTATTEDFNKNVLDCLTGEMRMFGLRRVYNVVGFTDFASGWSGNPITVGTDPTYGDYANMTALAGGGIYNSVKSDTTAYTEHLFRFYLKAPDQTGILDVLEWQSASNGRYQVDLTMISATEFELITPDHPAVTKITSIISPTSTSGLWFRSPIGTVNVQIAQPAMYLKKDGQTKVDPEFVSRGELTTPFHGYGVDGVNYFTTDENGNAITGTTKGLLIEAITATNQSFYSEDWTDAAHTKDNVTAAIAATGMKGRRATRVTETTANNIHSINANTISAVTEYVASVLVRRPAGGTRHYMARLYSSATNWEAATIDMSNGTVSQIDSGSLSSFSITWSVEDMGDGVYRVTAKGTCVITNVIWSHYMVNTTTPTVSAGGDPASYTGSVSEHMEFTAAMFEKALFASQYIPTTSAAVSRSNDALTYQHGLSDGAFGPDRGYVNMEFARIRHGTAIAHYLYRSTNSSFFRSTSNYSITMFDSTNIAQVFRTTQTELDDLPHTLSVEWGTDITATIDAEVATAAFDGTMFPTAATGAFTVCLLNNAIIKNITFEERA